MRYLRLAIVTAALSLALVPEARADAGARILTAPGLTLPASFTGTTPMASGPGMGWHLDLWPDQVFHLRQTAGDDAGASDIGRWSADPARGAIVLRGGRAAPVFLEILGTGDLRLMTPEGRPIDSDLPYTLVAGPLEPVEVALSMAGMVRYMADAATFTECRTGRTHPVAMAGAHVEAERAYTGLEGRAPGAPVLALLDGRLAMRPAMEGPDRIHLVIDRFAQLDPDADCPAPRAEATLTDTWWRITDIAGTALRPAPDRREPHLILRSGDPPAYGASLGCNRLRGRLALEGDSLSFGPAATTRMACPPPLDTREQALAQALARVAGWQIDTTTLELFDAAGARLLRAEAAYID